MSFVLRLIHPTGKSALADEATAAALGVAATRNEIELGDYLEWSDPDGLKGRGDDRWTDDIAKAKRFPTFAAAMECWKAQSRLRPLRPDGKPNRPMTAYSVTVQEVDP